MFCSSLRQKRPWSASVSALLKAPSPGWKEARLEGHDLAFPLRDDHKLNFKVLLLSTGEKNSSDFSAQVERLRVLNGGCDIAIVLLMDGRDSMVRFIQLQTELSHDAYVPVLPISAPSELMSCLGNLRKSYHQPTVDDTRVTQTARSRDALTHCVEGKRLTAYQVNVITDVTPSLQDLARCGVDGNRQQRFVDYIGDVDCRRITRFLMNGPRPNTLETGHVGAMDGCL